jgi:hypothetical protein
MAINKFKYISIHIYYILKLEELDYFQHKRMHFPNECGFLGIIEERG